jgi:hypothetical protein
VQFEYDKPFVPNPLAVPSLPKVYYTNGDGLVANFTNYRSLVSSECLAVRQRHCI